MVNTSLLTFSKLFRKVQLLIIIIMFFFLGRLRDSFFQLLLVRLSLLFLLFPSPLKIFLSSTTAIGNPKK